MISILKKLGLDKIIRALQIRAWTWLLVSIYTRKKAKNRGVSKTILDKKIKRVIRLKSHLSHNKKYPDVERLLDAWLHEECQFEISHKSIEEILNVTHYDDAVICLTHARPRSLIGTFMLARKFKNRNLPVLAFHIDTYEASEASRLSLLTSSTGGRHIFLQNTKTECEIYGYSNSLSPIFWTFPSFRSNAYLPIKPWSERQNLCIFPSPGADPEYRKYVTKKIINKILPKNFQKIIAGEIPYKGYINTLRVAKIYVTTCKVQKGYWVGPQIYKRKMSKTTVTGQAWEAFAAGIALITNSNKVFNELGFEPGVHYIDLDTILCENSVLCSDERLQTIAKNGHELFLKLLKREDLNEIRNFL